MPKKPLVQPADTLQPFPSAGRFKGLVRKRHHLREFPWGVQESMIPGGTISMNPQSPIWNVRADITRRTDEVMHGQTDTPGRTR